MASPTGANPSPAVSSAARSRRGRRRPTAHRPGPERGGSCRPRPRRSPAAPGSILRGPAAKPAGRLHARPPVPPGGAGEARASAHRQREGLPLRSHELGAGLQTEVLDEHLPGSLEHLERRRPPPGRRVGPHEQRPPVLADGSAATSASRSAVTSAGAVSSSSSARRSSTVSRSSTRRARSMIVRAATRRAQRREGPATTRAPAGARPDRWCPCRASRTATRRLRRRPAGGVRWCARCTLVRASAGGQRGGSGWSCGPPPADRPTTPPRSATPACCTRRRRPGQREGDGGVGRTSAPTRPARSARADPRTSTRTAAA